MLSENGPKPTKKFGAASGIATLLIGIIAFGVAKTAVRIGSDYFDRQSMTGASFEKSIESNEDLSGLYQPYKLYFPKEYHEMSAGVAAMIKQGSSKEQVHDYAFNSSRQFVLGHSLQIASASNNTLAEIASKNAAIASALSHDSLEACAAFGFEGITPEMTRSLSRDTKLLMASAMPLSIRAAHEGTVSPVARGTQLAPDDASSILRGLRRHGLSDAEINTLAGEHASDADVPSKCRETVALYGAVSEMPQAAAARVTAYFARDLAAKR